MYQFKDNSLTFEKYVIKLGVTELLFMKFYQKRALLIQENDLAD